MNLITTLGISAHAEGFDTNEVWVYAGTCEQCGEWGKIGTWNDVTCESCE